MPSAGSFHAFAHNLAEVDRGFFPARFLISRSSGAEHLFHSLGEAVGIAEHQAVKLLLLRLWQFAALQSFQMETDGSHRGLQFVRHCVDKAVVLFAAANFAQKEGCIHDHARDDQSKKDDAEEQQHSLAPVKDDPSNIQRDRECDQADAQAEKEYDGSAAARDAHGTRVILARSTRRVTKEDVTLEGLSSLM